MSDVENVPSIAKMLIDRQAAGDQSGRAGGRPSRRWWSSVAPVRRLQEVARLSSHAGCVNTIKWSSCGTLLLTGSDDCHLHVERLDWPARAPDWGAVAQRARVRTGHQANIFCARFVPGSGDAEAVSCGLDGQIRHVHLRADGDGPPPALLRSSPDPIHHLAFAPAHDRVLLAALQEGLVLQFDLRERAGLERTLADLSAATVGGLMANVVAPLDDNLLLVAASDPFVRLYDARRAGEIVERFCPRRIYDRFAASVSSRRHFYSLGVSGLSVGYAGEVVVAYTHDVAACFSSRLGANPVVNPEPGDLSANTLLWGGVRGGDIQIFTGHRNLRTTLKEIAFYGDGNFVCTGCDSGHVFFWDKLSGELVQVLRGDSRIVNGVAPHPTLPHIAICGIDSFGRLLFPGSGAVTFDPTLATQLRRRRDMVFGTTGYDEYRTHMMSMFLDMVEVRFPSNVGAHGPGVPEPERAATAERVDQMLHDLLNSMNYRTDDAGAGRTEESNADNADDSDDAADAADDVDDAEENDIFSAALRGEDYDLLHDDEGLLERYHDSDCDCSCSSSSEDSEYSDSALLDSSTPCKRSRVQPNDAGAAPAGDQKALEILRQTDDSLQVAKVYYDSGNVEEAMEAYARVDAQLDQYGYLAPNLSDELASRFQSQFARTWLNLAGCLVHLHRDPGKIVRLCTSAMRVTGPTATSLYRRAVGLHALGRYQAAREDLLAASAMAPSASKITELLHRCEAALREQGR